MQCNNHNYKLTLRVTQIRPQPRRCIVWPLVRSQQLTSNDTNATKHATEPPIHCGTKQPTSRTTFSPQSQPQPLPQPPTLLQVNGNFDDAYNGCEADAETEAEAVSVREAVAVHLIKAFFSASIPLISV